MKATAKAITNIKPMAGGVAIAQLQVGWYVFGDKGATDLLNFDYYYKTSGERVELGKPCKATLGNLILTNETEGDVPPPVEPPTDDTFPAYIPQGTEWQMRFKVPGGQYSEVFTFIRQ